MQHKSLRRLLSGILAAAVAVNGLIVATPANDNADDGSLSFTKVSNKSVSATLPGREVFEETKEASLYADTDVVRVSIVLKDKSTIEAGYEVKDIANNQAAMDYRAGLQRKQEDVVAQIEQEIEEQLDVVWNLTLAANIISANVEYGQIETIEELRDVKEVVIENQYQPDVLNQPIATDPNMATSSAQIGSTEAWAAGYTGAGSRVAIIDTGADYEHQSFDPDAFMNSLKELAEDANKTVDEYVAGLKLMTAAEIDSVKDKLNIGKRGSEALIDSSKAYLNAKIPFAYNYIDKNYTTNHANDTQGEHGSHVAGIATANKYIPNGDGTFDKALDTVMVQGVAPDAQLLVMKVFGAGGGAYDSDYMAAIEDAIVLNADSVNLSLGGGAPGMSTNATYQDVLDKIAESGVVVAMSAGNSGMWAENANNLTGYLYADDVSMQTDGSPGSYTNSLAVASVDNAGSVNNYFTVGETKIPYTETSYTNKPFTTLAGDELEYVFLDGDGFGTAADWAAIGDDLAGKVAVCWRGGISFYQKGNFAVEAGAIAVVLCNNTDGIINMDLSDYSKTAPFVSITQADGLLMKQLATRTEPAAANAEEEEVLPEGENTPAQADEETAPEADEETALEVDEEIAPETDEDASEADENEEAGEDETAPEEAEDTEAAEKNAEDVQAAATAAYYLGTLTVAEESGIFEDDSRYYTMSDFSSWGVPGSLQLKPEITAPGGNIYSVNGYHTEDGKNFVGGHDAYENMSGTSMASPQVAGMAAVAAQYVRDNKLVEKTGKSARVLIQSLLMSTAEPVIEDLGEDGASYYSILKQGAGLANINNVVTADSYILMKEDATVSYKDGKVKAELGDDPDRTGEYSFSFSINNITDTAKTYDLDSVFFIQYPFQYYTNQAGKIGYYMDTTTAIINTEATFSTGNSVTVAAGGSADVTVTIQLTDSDKEIIDEYYENGAYIEGFVYAESAGDAEGNEGTSHSIPVLGFYGSWTEASMFDVGSHIEKIAGEEDRIPYVAASLDSNAIGITYAGDSNQYYFGGNPVVPDETYMPERNAIGANGTISAITFVAIRNAADSRFTVYNETKDTLIKETKPGAVSSAYYYTNGGRWMNTGYTLRPMYTPTGVAEGDRINIALTLAPEYYVGADGTAWDKLGEGASLAVSATVDNIEPVISKVELDEENNVLRVVASDNNYIAGIVLYNNAGTTALSFEGAKQVIDAGEEAVYELSLDGVNGRKFLLQAYDYAMNTATYEIKQKLGGDVPLPERIAFNLDDNYWVGFEKTSDDSAMDIVYAPADKTFTAATIVDHIVFAATDGGELFVMPEDDLTDLTKVCDLGVVLTDMAYNSADGKIYAACSGYLITVDKLTGELEIVDEIPVLSNTLACDANGVFYCNEYGTPDVYSFTVEDGAISEPELLCSVDIPRAQYIQSMEIDPNDGMLCWNSYYAVSFFGMTFGFSYYYEVDPATGEFTKYEDRWVELSALIIPDKSEILYDFNGDGIVDYLDGQALLDYRTGVIDSIHNEEYADFNDDGIIDTYDAYLFFQILWTTPTRNITDIQISDEEISILRGSEYKLSAYVLPWTASNRDVAWSTSDASVATVDANGNVTAVEKGECVITATSKANKEIKAQCAVTVDVVDVTLNGVLQDADGNPLFFEWNMAEDSTWTKVHDLGTSLTSATQVDGNTVFVMDGIADTWAMHKVDAATGDVLETAANPLEVPFWDMQYSDVFSDPSDPMVTGIYGYYLFSPKDPMNLAFGQFNLQSFLNQYGGASWFVALTSMGAEEVYDENDDVVRDTERLIALDDAGNFWIINMYSTAEGYSALLDFYTSDLNESFPGYDDDMYCSMVYGNDGRLYLSAFDGDTNNFYRITMDDVTGTCKTEYIGNVGDTVWPAALLSADSNAPAPASASTSFFSANGLNSVKPKDQVKVDAVTVTERDKITLNAEITEDVSSEEVVLASVKSSFGASDSEDTAEENVDVKTIDKNTETFTIQLGATNSDNEPVDSTNGLAIVTYDPEVLELVSVDIDADYTSVKIDEEIGFAILGYVSPEEAIPAGTLFETLTFKVKDIEKADGTLIGVGVAELGNGGTAEEPNHSNLLIEYSTPLYENIDDAETIAEIMEDILPSTNVRVEVSEEPVPDDPDEPVVIIPSNGNFIDPYAPGGALAPETTEPGETPSESNDPSGNDPAGSEPANNDPASSDPAGNDPSGNDPSGNEVSTGTNAPESGDGNGNAGNAGDVNAPNDEDKNQYTGVALFIAPAAISALAVLVTKKHGK